MAKLVYKYATGEALPDGAVYLWSRTETVLGGRELVWHYFLVEADK